MRRNLRLVILLLLAGAGTNVLVAWWAASVGPWAYTDGRPEMAIVEVARAQRIWSSASSTPSWSVESAASGDRNAVSAWYVVTAQDRTSDEPFLSRSAVLHVYRFGWPLHSMQWSVTYQRDPYRLVTRHRMAWFEDDKPDGTIERRGIPLRPVWGAFAANTLIYVLVIAIVFWPPIGGRRRIRRYRRRRKGLCSACAYDVRGAKHERCPECGEKIAHA